MGRTLTGGRSFQCHSRSAVRRQAALVQQHHLYTTAAVHFHLGNNSVITVHDIAIWRLKLPLSTWC